MVKIYLESLKMELKSQLEYKASFIMNFVSQIGVMFSLYFMIIALFQKFSNINGFTVYEVLLCFSIIQFGFSFNETFFRGVDKFEDLIVDGSLDRILLRPQGILFQVNCEKMDFVKLSRILQSIIVMIIAIVKLNIKFTLDKIICLLLMIIASVVIFYGLFVLMASYCFYTVQGLEIKNLMTDGGKQAAFYPIGIYKKGLALVFTYVIPYAFVNYYPLLYFTGKSTNILYMISPLLVFVFLVPCLLLFRYGLKHYSSTGS